MAKLHTFIAYLPDKPNVAELRAAQRPFHVERSIGLLKNGTYSYGGAMTSEPFDPAEGGKPAIVGSVIVVHAESKAAVLELLKADPYQDVWDWDKAVVNSFIVTPMPA